MSRIGKKDIFVPDGIKILYDNNTIKVFRENDSNTLKALHGLIRKLIYNSVTGFCHPFRKVLQIRGVGFKASVSTNDLVLTVGFSHNVNIKIPKEVLVKIDSKQNQILFESYNNNILGEFVAKIRSVRPPEPYKSTGIMYVGEKIIRKAGKSASSKK